MIPLPDEWFKEKDGKFFVEADFRYDWSDPNQDFDMLKMGHTLLHFIDESDKNLIEARISNSIT
jgi:hypothetical protein